VADLCVTYEEKRTELDSSSHGRGCPPRTPLPCFCLVCSYNFTHYRKYVCPPLRSSGQVSGYRSRGPSSIPGATGFSREAVGLERGPLNHVSTIEELVGRKNSGFGQEHLDYGRRDPSRRPRDPLSTKVGTNFSDHRRSLGWYSSLTA
jgi:hypothetical protein